MLNLSEVISRLESLGSESTVRVLKKHGAKDPCFGVRVADLKVVLKELKPNHDLAIELFDSGIFDAMYLAGLLMDGSTMTREELNSWAQTDYGSSISSYSVPWVASESRYGMELALEWIRSPKEFVAVSGWSALSSIVSVTNDDKLDLKLLASLLQEVETAIEVAPNKVKQAMNEFVISIGSFVLPLTDMARATAKNMGKIKVDMGDTECKISDAYEYIDKVFARGKLGIKKKTAKC